MGVSGLQLPFCRNRLPSPAAIMRHCILTDSVVRGAPSMTGSPAQSAGIRFGLSVTISGGGLPWKRVESRPGLKPPGGARPVPVATSNTLRVLEAAERIMCSSEGHISVLRTHSYSGCSVVEAIHLIDSTVPDLVTRRHLVLSCLCIFCFAVPKEGRRGTSSCGLSSVEERFFNRPYPYPKSRKCQGLSAFPVIPPDLRPLEPSGLGTSPQDQERISAFDVHK